MSNNGIPALNDWQADNYATVYDEGAAKLYYVKTGSKVEIPLGGDGVQSVNDGFGVTIDNTDPTAPIVNADFKIDAASPSSVTTFWAGSQAQYDGLTPDASTIYFITA